MLSCQKDSELERIEQPVHGGGGCSGAPVPLGI